MLAKRIIAALDIKNGRVVKGVRFRNIQEVGTAVKFARKYEEQGADEIVFLDISASLEKRKILAKLAREVASVIFIPFTVGGGIACLEDAVEIIRNGADKIFINTAAVENPRLIKEIAKVIGKANLVVAIDAKWNGEFWEVFIYSGSKPTGLCAIEWAKVAERKGAGEILLTAIDRDGTQKGFSVELIKQVRDAVSIPIIASGGAGRPEHFYEAFIAGADAALAASILHYGKYTIADIKRYLRRRGVNARI